MSYSDFILGNKVILCGCLFVTGKKNPVQKTPSCYTAVYNLREFHLFDATTSTNCM